jgi:hypothetical protein
MIGFFISIGISFHPVIAVDRFQVFDRQGAGPDVKDSRVDESQSRKNLILERPNTLEQSY